MTIKEIWEDKDGRVFKLCMKSTLTYVTLVGMLTVSCLTMTEILLLPLVLTIAIRAIIKWC